MVHKYDLRVRYSDTDKMQRLHHAAYVEYLEVVRIEFLRCLGISYDALEQSGYLLPVSKLRLNYRQGARYDEVLTFETRVVLDSRVRLTFRSEIRTTNAEIATAEVELACIDGVHHRPCKMPDELFEALQNASS
ncbi:MAG: thioesterase [Flavobacteriales bacterium]|nr:thioesterase [Flavobacteriales bacterium]